MVDYKPWKVVDDPYYPMPVCVECGGFLERDYEDKADPTPLAKDCPYCGAVLRVDG